MGYALAAEAAARKWNVTLISGPVDLKAPAGVKLVRILSATDMYREVNKRFSKTDVLIGAAAVADWRPARTSRIKLKKSSVAPVVGLAANPDILLEMGKIKGRRIIAGFALETHNLKNSARLKLKRKNMDLIIANTPSAIGKDFSQALLIDADGTETSLRGTKALIAKRILDAVYKKTRYI
jgi:phosphopantothenoylcysteine synthetase/decarboxylase